MIDEMVFDDRSDAGRRLAEPLKRLALVSPLVLAIPRGGVAVGAALARELGAELDVVFARKLRCPGYPELAVGAVAEDGTVYLNPDAEAIPGLTEAYLERERDFQAAEIARRARLVRAVRPAAGIAGRTVVVTDDGLATGSTMIAALDAVRSQAPAEVVVALPVASPERLGSVRRRCHRLVCLAAPEGFRAVGQYYMDFRPVEDDEVVRLLREFAPSPPTPATFA